MKNKIYILFALLAAFCFISCSNIIQEKEVNDSASETYVCFNFGNERAIVSYAYPENYTYTLRGTCNGKTSTLCDKLPYQKFISERFEVFHGEWTFELTAYNDTTAVFGASTTQTLNTGSNSVSFVLHALTGGRGKISITLSYPSSADVKTVLAGLYDSIPSAIPDLNSVPSECTVFSPEVSASSVTFECSSVPSGENRYVEFFLYDSQDFCIGSYLESVFLTTGEYISEHAQTFVNSFAATVELTVADQAWVDSGFVLKAVKAGKEYTLQPVANTNTFTASLPLGLYNIHKLNGDTGVTLSVKATGNSSATVNLAEREYITTAANIAQVFASLTGEANVFVVGKLTASDIETINEELKKTSYPIHLDLSDTYGLERLPMYAFEGCTNLETIEIPSSVKAIGTKDFYGCTSLKLIKIPSSVISIGDSAFYGCSSLSSIEIPATVTSIKEYAFSGCTNLASLEIPTSVTSISGDAFSGCTSLKSIKIPSSVTSIGCGIFRNCIGLASIEIPSSVTSIGGDAFSGCTSLSSIEIPTSVTSIGSGVFRDCTSLSSIEIPSSVTSIGNAAFYHCSSLKSIEIPSSVTSIGSSAFSNCTSLESIKIPSSVTSIENHVFSNCTSLTSIELPSSITSIAMCAFVSTKIASIKIPSSVTSIGKQVFYNCGSLASIEMPASVTSIGDQVFSYCHALKNITFEDPDNWFVEISSEQTESVDLSNSSENARYFRNTYQNYSWIKKDQ